MITFIHPFAFVWLLLAVPIVLFYVWRLPRRRVEVSTSPLWQKALPPLHPRRAWQKQRRLVSLAIQLALLFFFVLALAEPCWRRPQRVALVVDCTSSMKVQDASGKTRAELAREHAQNLAQNLGYNDSMAIITVGEDIQILSRMSNNREAIQNLLASDAMPAPGGCASVEDAVEMARSLIRARDGKYAPETCHAVLISDGCFPRAEVVIQNEETRWIAVGESVGNVELETLSAARRDSSSPETFEILSGLRNHSNDKVVGTLSIFINDALFEEKSVEIPPVSEGGCAFVVTQGKNAAAFKIRAEFKAQNAIQDALLDDNDAQAALHEAYCFNVAIFSPEKDNFLLENAFRELPEVQLTTFEGSAENWGALRDYSNKVVELENGVKQYSVVVLDRVLPDDFAQAVPNGRFLIFSPPRSTEFWTRASEARDFVAMPWLDGLRSGISTAGVGFTSSHQLTPRAPADFPNLRATPWLFSQSALHGADVPQQSDAAKTPENTGEENYAKAAQTVELTELAWGIDLSAISDASPDSAEAFGGRLALVSCDLSQSDWSLAKDFPRFLRYSLDWLAASEAADFRLQSGIEPQKLVSETTRDCNLNLPPIPEATFQFPGEDIVPFWSILVVIIVALLVVEWALYNRRWLE
ncbi:MAG: BatA and WFA domain-containing protein [Planctomycetia bacterium]|nr:BatA and WFA domain-containing protein [Planctomycetia bacterium]